MRALVATFTALTVLAGSAIAQDVAAPSATLITNARIFDGKGDTLSGPMSVLVEGDKITRIAETIDAPEGATVIDAGGLLGDMEN